MEHLEDAQMALGGMASNRYAAPFREQVTSWLGKLDAVGEQVRALGFWSFQVWGLGLGFGAGLGWALSGMAVKASASRPPPGWASWTASRSRCARCPLAAHHCANSCWPVLQVRPSGAAGLALGKRAVLW